MNPGASDQREHAIVIGGSIAGLLAAGVLAKHYSKVTLIDADALSNINAARKGVPQGNHVHGVLRKGWQQMLSVFPNLEKKVSDAGAVWLDVGTEIKWHYFGVERATFESKGRTPFLGRPTLESLIFQELEELKNVECLSATFVEEYVGTADTVQGVKLRGGQECMADLVVDASGRGSRTPKWLEKLGGEAPEELSIPASVSYASCEFTQPKQKFDWRVLYISPQDAAGGAGVIFPTENGNWLVTLTGRNLAQPPRTHEAFIEFAKSLPSDAMVHALKGAEPLSEVRTYRFAKSLRRLYEKVEMPAGLVVVGDAVCSFNPVFGQGMTVCAMEATHLDNTLEASTGGDWQKSFQKEISRYVNVAWEMIEVEDLRYPDVHGLRSLKVKLMQAFTSAVCRKSEKDAYLSHLFDEIVHFETPPTALMRLKVLLRLCC